MQMACIISILDPNPPRLDLKLNNKLDCISHYAKFYVDKHTPYIAAESWERNSSWLEILESLWEEMTHFSLLGMPKGNFIGESQAPLTKISIPSPFKRELRAIEIKAKG